MDRQAHTIIMPCRYCILRNTISKIFFMTHRKCTLRKMTDITVIYLFNNISQINQLRKYFTTLNVGVSPSVQDFEKYFKMLNNHAITGINNNCVSIVNSSSGFDKFKQILHSFFDQLTGTDQLLLHGIIHWHPCSDMLE